MSRVEGSDNLRIFVDSDVLFAGSASPSTQSASIIILGLGGLGRVTCVISEQVRTEATRNIRKKILGAEAKLQEFIANAVTLVADPTVETVARYKGQADPKDAPILAAAIENGCRYLVTFNTRDYCPRVGQITVSTPGELLSRLRELLGEI